MKLGLSIISCLLFTLTATAQYQTSPAYLWADSVFKTLNDDQRIAQLMVVRSSGMDSTGAPVLYNEKIDSLVSKYNIGAICMFQGSPYQQAAMLNRIQGMAKTPLMVTVDAEWGLGMRFAGVKGFPYNLTLGALQDAELVYKIGKAIGDQCRRMNIHVNYAPVVDINNNPDNPVIGIRSFGEDKYKVALMGTRMMEGIQDRGVMACAKHFPGHGDVAVDSHFDLPVINKSLAQLDSLELYPFRQLFRKGVGSVMIAHLYIPAIDSTPNRATTLSYNNVTGLLHNQLEYNGLTFTDALEMKGVTKYYPGGEAAVQSLIAGNDMLCLPADVPETIEAVKKAVAEGRLTWIQVHVKCKKVLAAKYNYVRGKNNPIDTSNLLKDLNAAVPSIRKEVAEKALTVLSLQPGMLPLIKPQAAGKKTKKTTPSANSVVYVAVGSDGKNELAARLKKALHAAVIALPYKDSAALASFNISLLNKYKKIVVGVHGIGRSPAKNFGISSKAVDIIDSIQSAYSNSILLSFGNPYVNKNFASSPNLVACYEDDSIFQGVAADWLLGKFDATGTLPVTVGPFPYGSGIVKKKPLN